jgi:tRNA C32,U32 (ribose-2'-O)-methylase TrmJ
MYGQLPSYIQANATTFDIMVYDVMMSWEEHQRNQSEGKAETPKLSQEQMMAMLEKVRKK